MNNKESIMENDPETLIQSLKTAWPALGGAIAAIAAIAIKFRPIVAFLPKAWKVCAALLVGPTKILEKMEEQDKQRVADQETVAKINESLTVVIKRLDNQDEKLKELVHNGGSSIKDAVVNISNQISILDKKCNVLFEASGKAVYECDKNGDCVWANKNLLRIYGLDFSEVLGKKWLAALHPEDVEKTVEHFNYCLKNKTPYRARYRIIRDEQVINVETTAIISKNAKDEVTGVVGEVRVIE